MSDYIAGIFFGIWLAVMLIGIYKSFEAIRIFLQGLLALAFLILASPALLIYGIYYLGQQMEEVE